MMWLSAERLSGLIGLIYDCAIDPEAWQSNLDTIRRDLRFHNAALSVHALPSSTLILAVVTGPAPEFIASMPDYNSDVIELWGGLNRLVQHPLEEPMVQSRVTGREALLASRWYREWGGPQGVFDGIGIGFLRDATSLGSIGMGRHISAGEITDADLVPLRIIAPHFRRAVSINRLLKLQAIQVSTFSATLDGLETAVVFVDEHMRIAYANTAAVNVLKTGDLMVQYQGALRLRDQAAAEEVATAVELVLRDEARLGRRGIGIPARRHGGGACRDLCPSASRQLGARGADAFRRRGAVLHAGAGLVSDPDRRPGATLQSHPDRSAHHGIGRQREHLGGDGQAAQDRLEHRQVSPQACLRQDRVPASGRSHRVRERVPPARVVGMPIARSRPTVDE